MLILTRKIDGRLMFLIDGEVVASVMVLGVERDRVKLGITADDDITVLREELLPCENINRRVR